MGGSMRVAKSRNHHNILPQVPLIMHHAPKVEWWLCVPSTNKCEFTIGPNEEGQATARFRLSSFMGGSVLVAEPVMYASSIRFPLMMHFVPTS